MGAVSYIDLSIWMQLQSMGLNLNFLPLVSHELILTPDYLYIVSWHRCRDPTYIPFLAKQFRVIFKVSLCEGWSFGCQIRRMLKAWGALLHELVARQTTCVFFRFDISLGWWLRGHQFLYDCSLQITAQSSQPCPAERTNSSLLAWCLSPFSDRIWSRSKLLQFLQSMTGMGLEMMMMRMMKTLWYLTLQGREPTIKILALKTKADNFESEAWSLRMCWPSRGKPAKGVWGATNGHRPYKI